MKDTRNRMKKQTTKWKKIFAEDIPEQDCYPKYTKNS